MEAQVIGKSAVLLTGKSVNVVIDLDGEITDLSKYSPNLVIGGHDDAKKEAYQIVSPGEYERSDVLVSAYQKDVSQDNHRADIFEADIENVNVCFVGRNVNEIPDSILDEMGVVNILFVFAEEVDLAKKIVNDIDPHIVVPMGVDEEGVKKFMTTIGLAGFETENKLKAKQEEFVGEEIPMRLVRLAK